MEDLIKRLKKIGVGMFFEKGASQADIEAFEKEQALRLPEDYRQWLMFTNGAEIFAPGCCLLGIDPGTWNLAKANTAAERTGYEMIDDLYIIGTQNYGDPVCFDRETFEIVQWDHEIRTPACAWDSFSEFLEDMIAGET